MAKDPTAFADVVELLSDYEEDLEDGRLVASEASYDLSLRLERARDVRERFEREFA